jgi:type II secretory pathway pseudopilin PulG
MLTSYGSMVDKYNSLVSQVQQANERREVEQASSNCQAAAELARQQRIQSVLMMYSAMPKYTPPPLQIYQPPPSLNIHCTSNRVGTYTYTTCN